MYRGLDSARALAFLLIFFHHNHLADYGAVSIQAFFVLSGFLLTPILVQMRSGLEPVRSSSISTDAAPCGYFRSTTSRSSRWAPRYGYRNA